MPRRVPLPRELAGRAFSVREGRERGLTYDRLDGRDLARPFHGVRAAADEAPTLRELCTAYRERMPGHEVFSHTTAGLLIGLPLPRSAEREHRLHVSAFAPNNAPKTAGIAGHQFHPAPGDVGIWDGFPVTSPVRTWMDLATGLTWRALTAVGDHLVSGRAPLATIDELTAAVRGAKGRRGIRALRRALEHVRPGSLSPMETSTRLLLVEAGLPEPELNANIYAADGTFLAMADLAFPAYRVIIEYQGDYHRTERGRYRADIVRRERLEDAGWRVILITADDVFLRPRETIRRVATALRAHGWTAAPPSCAESA